MLVVAGVGGGFGLSSCVVDVTSVEVSVELEHCECNENSEEFGGGVESVLYFYRGGGFQFDCIFLDIRDDCWVAVQHDWRE